MYTRIQDEVGIDEFSALVEELGFDSLWATESVVTEEPGLDCLTTLGAFAEKTRGITLGSCVLLLPLRNPVILAKEVATLDFLSGGRFILGVGSGGEALKSFRVCGVSTKERGARCDEALEIMAKLWTGRRVSHKGRFYSFEEIYMEPVPVQRPHPPIWIGGEAEPVLWRTARYGDGFVPVNLTPAGYDRALRRIGRYARECGRDASAITGALHLYFLLGDDEEETRARASDSISHRYGWPVEFPRERGCAFGTPYDCVRTIQRFASAGVEHLVLNAACDRGEVVPQLRRFAREVMPHFR